MRFQVPQFIDIQDKVVGPLTLKQFFIYLGGVFVLIPLYFTFDVSLFITVAIPIIGLTALFAHFRLNGQSLFQVVGNATGYFLRGQLFLWRRTGQEKPLKLDGHTSSDAYMAGEGSGLSSMARALATEGSIVKADMPDPITGDSA